MDPLLDNLLSDDDLDKAIQNNPPLITLDALIQIKQKRLDSHRGDKVKFSISHIIDITGEENAKLTGEVLKKALLIVQDRDKQIEEAIELLIAHCHIEPDKEEEEAEEEEMVDHPYTNLQTLQLLSVLLECAPNIVKNKADLIDPIILAFFCSGSHPKQLDKFILIHLLPKYLELNENSEFAHKIFLSIKRSKRLDALCYLYKHLVNGKLLEQDEYWLFLHENLSIDFSRKQCSFLLSKSLETAYSLEGAVPPRDKVQSQYLGEYTSNETKKAWESFFTLLDISSEKQLHLVEPPLQLLGSIQILNRLWQDSLYRILLSHTQTVVVYTVCLHLLQNWVLLENGSVLLDALLVAVNRNEYSTISDQVFDAIAEFCQKTSQFERVLWRSLDVTWNPVAAWCLYSNIFRVDADFQIPLALCEKLIHAIESLPHIFIRESCIRIVCEHFKEHFSTSSTFELVITAFMLKKLCPDMLQLFLFNRQFNLNLTELESVIKATFRQERPPVVFLRLLLRMLRLLRLPNSVFKKTIRDLELPQELVFMIWPNTVDEDDLMTYVMMYVDSTDNVPDIMKCITFEYTFASIFKRKYCQSKAHSVLLELSQNRRFSSRDIRRLSIVSEILRNGCDIKEYQIVTNSWKHKFLNVSGKIEEPIVTCFLISFLRARRAEHLERDAMEETILILNNILDLGYSSTLPMIFENLSLFYPYKKYEDLIRPFVDRCFVELVKIAKSNLFLRYSKYFFTGVLNNSLWNHDRMTDDFKDLICNIVKQTVNSLAKDKSELAFILVSCLSNVVAHFPQKCFNLIEAIVELYLRTGVIFRRSERIEHGIYHDISLRLPQGDPSNPIWIDAATKLKTVDFMLTMAKRAPGAADAFISLLLERYMHHFDKRYFPDSQVHIEKLRILQAMLVIHPYIDSANREKVIDLIAESFLCESHQPSVRHLMQWLMIRLLSLHDISAVEYISDKLKKANNSRPTSVTAFIPVLYHLCAGQDESRWNAVVATLLPYTMGAQFKLRAFSQAAIKKLYETARQMGFQTFVNHYTELYNSVNFVIESSGGPFYDVVNLENDFLEYFPINGNEDELFFLNIYYCIPERCAVTPTEWQHVLEKYIDVFKLTQAPSSYAEAAKWQNTTDAYRANFYGLGRCDYELFSAISFKQVLPPKKKAKLYSEYNAGGIGTSGTDDNFQRKITPWKNALAEEKVFGPQTEFILVTSLLEKKANLGGLMRTCEVFGVKQMVMKTAKVVDDKEFKSLSMSSENWVDIAEVKAEDMREFILDIKTNGYRVVGAEQTCKSVKLQHYDFSKKTVLILGNEKAGISQDLLPLIDDFVEIPQYGMVRSLNVHVAGAIVIYEYRRQQA